MVCTCVEHSKIWTQHNFGTPRAVYEFQMFYAERIEELHVIGHDDVARPFSTLRDIGFEIHSSADASHMRSRSILEGSFTRIEGTLEYKSEFNLYR